MAVEAFLAGRIRWIDIAGVGNAVLERHALSMPSTVDDVIAADHEARRLATEHVAYISARETA